MSRPASCSTCSFHQPNKHLCRRHAPGSTDRRFEVAKWPSTELDSRCGEGKTDEGPIPCDSCIYFWRPGGISPDPGDGSANGAVKPSLWTVNKSAKWDTEWWRNAGYCVRYAPSPGNETRTAYPRITHSRLDGCGDGEAPDADKDDEDCVVDVPTDLTVSDPLLEHEH